MRAAKLPPLGEFTTGLALRIAVAKAISEAEVYAKRGSALPPGVAKLETFANAILTAMTAIKAYPASIAATAADTALSLASDQTEQIVVTKTPLSGSTSNVASDTANTKYTSSDTAVITVSATGLVTAVGVGSATVTVRHANKQADPLAFTVAA